MSTHSYMSTPPFPAIHSSIGPLPSRKATALASWCFTTLSTFSSLLAAAAPHALFHPFAPPPAAPSGSADGIVSVLTTTTFPNILTTKFLPLASESHEYGTRAAA